MPDKLNGKWKLWRLAVVITVLMVLNNMSASELTTATALYNSIGLA